ncbi:MAG: hypothetical protein ACETWQ_04185 [Phycisphaerae bacterium]
MFKHLIRSSILSLVVLVSFAVATEPTFQQRTVSEIKEQSVDLSTDTAHYKSMFGVGDPNSQIVKGVARFGELTVEPGGRSKTVNYESEEQIYYILEGNVP